MFPMLSSSQELVTEYLVYGASGTCAQVAFEARHQAGGTAVQRGYIDDLKSGFDHPYDGLPVLSFDGARAFPHAAVLVPVHSTDGRRALHDRVLSSGRTLVGMAGDAHLVHPSAQLGQATIIACGSRVGPGVVTGRGPMLLGDLVGHDVELGDFVTLAMHSIVLGHVVLGSGAYVGPGAVVGNGTATRPLRIGEGAIIGTGAVVDRDVAPGETIVGNRGMSARSWARLRRLARGAV